MAAPNRSRWIGRRDHALLSVAIQTGLRVTELTSLRCQDVRLGTGLHVQAPREGPQGPRHTVDQTHRRRAARMAHGAPRPTAAATVPDHPWPPAQSRCDRAARRQARHHRQPQLPDADEQESLAAHAPAHRHDEPAARRRRQHPPYGSAASPSRPPRSTSTATCNARNERSRAPPRRTAHRAATARRTHCSRSSKRSDYAEHLQPIPAANRDSRRHSA